MEGGGLGRRGRCEGEGEWRPGLRPSRTLAGALLVGDVGEDGAFGWREAPTHRWRPAAEASDLVGLDGRLEARPSQHAAPPHGECSQPAPGSRDSRGRAWAGGQGRAQGCG